MTSFNGDNNFSLSHNINRTRWRKVGEKRTNQWIVSPANLYSSLETRKKEILYILLDFENGLTKDAPVGRRAYISAIARNELNRLKHQATKKIFKVDEPPNFQVKLANGQLEKPLAATTLKFDNGDNTFAERFVVRNNLTGPNVSLHFRRHNSVVADTTHSLIRFPHLTMQVKTAASKTSAKRQSVLTDDALMTPPRTMKTIRDFVDHPS